MIHSQEILCVAHRDLYKQWWEKKKSGGGTMASPRRYNFFGLAIVASLSGT